MFGAKDQEDALHFEKLSKSPKSARSTNQFEERTALAKSTKSIVKIIETQYLQSQCLEDLKATDVANILLQEAMKLAGLQYFQPSQKQIETLAQLLDQNGDGMINSKDLETKVDYFLKGCPASQDNYNSGASRSQKSSGNLFAQGNSERAMLRKNLTEKFPGGFEKLISTCKSIFDKYDQSRDNTVEYDQLLPMLVDVYSLFGINFQPGPQDSRRYIEVIDADRDGAISWADFELFLLRVLDSLENVKSLPGETQ